MSYIDDLKAAIKEQEARFESARLELASQRRYVPVPAYLDSQNNLEALRNELKMAELQLSKQSFNIPQNTQNQYGESITPVITQIQKPENQGLILLAGLVAAVFIFK